MEILTLGKKIKQKRKEQNMTLKDLAGDKVTPGQISLVESGKSKPSIDLLEYIAEKMNVSIDYILETEEHQAEKLCQYYSKIACASLYAENYEQAKEAISKGMIYAKDYNLDYYAGLNDLYSGNIEQARENYKQAQSYYISANEVFLKVGKMYDAIDTYMQLGLTAYKLSYFSSSLNFYKQAEKLIDRHKISDDDMLMRIYFNISLCYSMTDDYSSAIDYVLLAMEKLKKKNDSHQYGQSLLMLSLSYNSLKKFDEALIYADKAIHVFKELDNLNLTAKIETNMGIMLSDIGNIDESFKHLKNAYRIKVETKDKTLPLTMFRMIDNYLNINEVDKAMEILNDACDKCNTEEFQEYRVQVYYYYYKVYLTMDDKKNAELNLLEAIKYLQGMDMPKELADIYILIGEFYDSEGKQTEALEFFNKGISLYKELGMIWLKSII